MTSEQGQRRGRPRDTAREAAILTVVTDLLLERGYEEVSFDEVARRAGASKATLYRRWPTRRDMVIAALRTGPARGTNNSPIDTGSLRGDLLALCHRLLDTLAATDSRTAMTLLQAGLDQPALCDDIETAFGPTGARLPVDVIASAQQRGELASNVNPFVFDETVGSVLLLRVLNGLDVGDDYLAALVDTVLVPALTESATHVALPAGIFSGRAAPRNTTKEDSTT